MQCSHWATSKTWAIFPRKFYFRHLYHIFHINHESTTFRKQKCFSCQSSAVLAYIAGKRVEQKKKISPIWVYRNNNVGKPKFHHKANWLHTFPICNICSSVHTDFLRLRSTDDKWKKQVSSKTCPKNSHPISVKCDWTISLRYGIHKAHGVNCSVSLRFRICPSTFPQRSCYLNKYTCNQKKKQTFGWAWSRRLGETEKGLLCGMNHIHRIMFCIKSLCFTKNLYTFLNVTNVLDVTELRQSEMHQWKAFRQFVLTNWT